jgi:hypothetical protein
MAAEPDATAARAMLGGRSAEAAADDPDWLEALVARSPLLPDAQLRQHWRRVIAWLPPAARQELAEVLLGVEQA